LNNLGWRVALLPASYFLAIGQFHPPRPGRGEAIIFS